MLNKILQIIFLTFLLNNSLIGQYIPLVEEGKFWIYLNYADPDYPQAVSGHAITFIGDTLINDKTYKKVFQLNLKGDHDCPPSYMPCWGFDYPYETESKLNISFIREDTIDKKIYNLPIWVNNSCGTGEYVLFDYSVNIGDTLNCSVYQSIRADLTDGGGIVDSIKIIETHGKLRNSIFTFGLYLVTGLPFETEIPISEGIGFRDFGIFYRQDSDFVDYCEGAIDQCQIILSNKYIHGSEGINIFPNPSSGIFQVSIEKDRIKSIRAYSILGQLEKEAANTNTIDLSDTEKGIYILEIITKGEHRIIKKIKKD